MKLSCPIVAIEHGAEGVTVTYEEFGEEKKMSADFLANCIPLPAFRKIPVTPAFPPEKQYVVDNVTCRRSLHRFVSALPDCVRVTVASRVSAPIPLARLRARLAR